ncbi:hypothetical protein IP79_13775 [Porphyrobacter sp. AAP60]|nr:hypothetical protein IP79_13775 [Porphyrobacter sp. AAP60]
MKTAGLAFCAAMLAACSSPEDVADKTGVGKATATASAGGNAAATASAAAAAEQAAGAVAFEDNSSKDEAVREFAYSWPAQVSAVPELVGRLTGERDTLLADQKAEWNEAIREFAGQDCVSCVNRGFEKSWQVVADLPRYLSLSADFYVYTGGAHGNSAHDALVWDREAKAAFDPKAMFTSPAALQTALGDAWCKALKVERMKRMGDDYSDDGFFQCPPIADLTVLPGSSNKQTFNRIGLLAAPYVAGSYAEGTYEVTLPVTAAVLKAVKPEYKAAFAAAK